MGKRKKGKMERQKRKIKEICGKVKSKDFEF